MVSKVIDKNARDVCKLAVLRGRWRDAPDEIVEIDAAIGRIEDGIHAETCLRIMRLNDRRRDFDEHARVFRGFCTICRDISRRHEHGLERRIYDCPGNAGRLFDN